MKSDISLSIQVNLLCLALKTVNFFAKMRDRIRRGFGVPFFFLFMMLKRNNKNVSFIENSKGTLSVSRVPKASSYEVGVPVNENRRLPHSCLLFYGGPGSKH